MSLEREVVTNDSRENALISMVASPWVLSYLVLLVVTQYKQRVVVAALVLRAAMTRLLTVCLEADTHLSQAPLTLLQTGDQDEEQAQEEELQGSEDGLEEDRAGERNEVEREKREGGEEKAPEEESLSESDGSEETEYIKGEMISDLDVSENEGDAYERAKGSEGKTDNLKSDGEERQSLEDGGGVVNVLECYTGASGERLVLDNSFIVDGKCYETDVTKNSVMENVKEDESKENEESPREYEHKKEWEVQRKRNVELGGRISSEVLGEFLDDDEDEDDVEHLCTADEESIFGDDMDSSFGVKDEDHSFDARSECDHEEIKIEHLHGHHGDIQKGNEKDSVSSVDKDSIKEEDSSLSDSLTDVPSEIDLNADRGKDAESLRGESEDGGEKVPKGKGSLRLKTRDEVDAAIRWIKDFPAPLPGPKCTCKVPGTPPWKPVQPSFFPAPETPKLSYTTTVLSLDKQLVTVKLRRPRSSSFNPQSVCEREREAGCGGALADRRGRVSLGEGDLSFSSEESAVARRGNSKDLKEKRRVLRSWSFWGSRSSQDDFSTPAAAPSPFSSPSPRSSPLCGSTLANLASPLRWSRVLNEKRKSAQSCIFPDACTPATPIGGGLASRVSSEPSVTPRARSGSHGDVSVTPRRPSKSLSGKRKAVRSCIFPDTVSEDYTPYMVSTPKEYEERQIVATPVCVSPNPRGMSPDSFASRCDSGYRTPEPRITRSESQLVRSEPPRIMPESRAKKGLSRPKRPQSLIIIPETQVGLQESPKRRQEMPPRRPQSLMIPPPEVLIPRRTPHASPRDAHPGLHPTRRHSISQFPRWSPGGETGREVLTPHGQSPRTCRPAHVHSASPAARSVEPVVRRATSSAERDRRRHVHSWSFSPSVSCVPFNPMISLSEGRPLQPSVIRSVRPRPLFPKDAEVFEHPASEA